MGYVRKILNKNRGKIVPIKSRIKTQHVKINKIEICPVQTKRVHKTLFSRTRVSSLLVPNPKMIINSASSKPSKTK